VTDHPPEHLAPRPSRRPSGEAFGDYIVYVDESGDHGLAQPDPDYPMFVLAFCIVRKDEYKTIISPAFDALKFKHFGHDMIVLHEHEIRKARGSFAFLTNAARRETFYADLNHAMANAPFTVVAVCIDKLKLKSAYKFPKNPYDLAMAYGLERVHRFLSSQGQGARTTHIVFEARGRREDDDLELEFRRVCDGANYQKTKLPFEFVLAPKRSNSCGLQLADLIARPIGLRVLRPQQPNRAYDLIEPKFYRDDAGRFIGRGLKCFP